MQVLTRYLNWRIAPLRQAFVERHYPSVGNFVPMVTPALIVGAALQVTG